MTAPLTLPLRWRGEDYDVTVRVVSPEDPVEVVRVRTAVCSNGGDCEICAHDARRIADDVPAVEALTLAAFIEMGEREAGRADDAADAARDEARGT